MPDSPSPTKSDKKPLTTAQKLEKTAFLIFCGEELKAKKTRQHPVNRLNSILKEFQSLPEDKKETYLQEARKKEIIFEVGKASPSKAVKSKTKESETNKRTRDKSSSEGENVKDSKPAAKRRRIQKTPQLRNTQQPARGDEEEEGDGFGSPEQSSTENDDNLPSRVKKHRSSRKDNKGNNEDKKRYSKSSDEDNPQEGSKKGKKKTKTPNTTPRTSDKSSTSKKPRDEKAPSRIIRANEFYLRKHSKSAREENPELNSKDLRKLVYDRFRELPPEVKKVYEDLAAEDKTRYNRQLEEYKARSS